MDQEEYPQSRTGAFGEGTTPGLAMRQEVENERIPTGFRASATNQQLAPSGIGSSSRDQHRIVYGQDRLHMLQTSNGMSQGTYEQKRPFLPLGLTLNL